MFRQFFKAVVLISVLLVSTVPIVQASRPDSHAPIGVMGEHRHKTGEFMFSYRYMTMQMEGNRAGTSEVSNTTALSQFMITPTEMTMEMHMFGMMWAPANMVTLMGMIPYVSNSMDHVNRMGRTFTTEADGLGDIKTTALVKLATFGSQHIHLNAGISFPTGAIDRHDDTLVSNAILPYPMQLGSGTVDLLPGLTYLGYGDLFAWGSQILATLRLGENDRDYTLGDRLETSLWGSINLADWVSSSLRLHAQSWGDIEGRDTELNALMVPTADPKRRAGDRVDLLIGVNLIGTGGVLEEHRLALEVGSPIYERLDGPQLETDLIATLGWQRAFGGK